MPRVTLSLVHVSRFYWSKVLTQQPRHCHVSNPSWRVCHVADTCHSPIGRVGWRGRHVICHVDADSSASAHVAEAYWTTWLELSNQLVPRVPLTCEWSLCFTRRRWRVQATHRLAGRIRCPDFFRWEVFRCPGLIGKVKTYKYPSLNSDISFTHKIKNQNMYMHYRTE